MTLRLHVPILPPPDHQYAAARLADALVDIESARTALEAAAKAAAVPQLCGRSLIWRDVLTVLRDEIVQARDELLR